MHSSRCRARPRVRARARRRASRHQAGELLLSGGAAVVTDFGIAKALSAARADRRLESHACGRALGTPMYMSPEQASADPNTDARTDIYALGAVAYEMLVGKPPSSHVHRNNCSRHTSPRPLWPLIRASRDSPGADGACDAMSGKTCGRPATSAEEVSESSRRSRRQAGESDRCRHPPGVSRDGLSFGSRSARSRWWVCWRLRVAAKPRGRLNPNRIVVAPFINLPGDSTLDVLGPLAAEGVTRGLEQLDSLTVVSSNAGMTTPTRPAAAHGQDRPAGDR